LFGALAADGKISSLPTPLAIDEDFVSEARKTGSPEARFRFSEPCLEAGCRQWTGTVCAVIERILNEMPDLDGGQRLPRCAIRGTCRWYHQRGGRACHACLFVVADQRSAASGDQEP
jgi:hypothetical protein